MKKEKGRPKRKDVMEAPFEIYRRSLPEAEQEKLALFFDDIKNHVMLAKGEVLKIRTDFENALLYYSSAGLSLDDALDRLSVSNLCWIVGIGDLENIHYSRVSSAPMNL